MSGAVAVRERPILFSGPMVRAILAGEKSVTRRVIKNPGRLEGEMLLGEEGEWCPFGKPGDRLWVRETWCPLDRAGWWDMTKPRDELFNVVGRPRRNGVAYRSHCDADSERTREELGYKWKPSIHMPRWASRISLEVIEVRVERLQEITEEEAQAEGRTLQDFGAGGPGYFPHTWDELNASRGYGWDANPWVWVVRFRTLARPSSDLLRDSRPSSLPRSPRPDLSMTKKNDYSEGMKNARSLPQRTK